MTEPLPLDDDTQPTPLRAVRAEVEAEAETGDGPVLVTLVTDNGEVDIRVPPVSRWRSSAKAALFSRGDDYTWAMTTLASEDFQAWAAADPTTEESAAFFTAWGRVTGQNLAGSRAERRNSTRTAHR